MDSGARESLGNTDGPQAGRSADACAVSVPRITSRELLGAIREIEIDHGGRIYRLRLTQSNKLILTA
jgi:hemin uptake protein HemP